MCVLLNVKCTLLLQSSQTKTHVFIYLLMDFGLLNDECRRNFEITANWLARLRNSCPYSKRVIIDSSSHTRMKMAFRWRTRPTNPSKCLKCASIQRSHTHNRVPVQKRIYLRHLLWFRAAINPIYIHAFIASASSTCHILPLFIYMFIVIC